MDVRGVALVSACAAVIGGLIGYAVAACAEKLDWPHE